MILLARARECWGILKLVGVCCMIKKKWTVHNVLEALRGGQSVSSECVASGVRLKVVTRGKTIAYLSYDEGEGQFHLQYTSAFDSSQMPSFHTKISQSHTVEPGKIYKSPVLWHDFARRVPSPKRADYKPELKRAGLTGQEPVLELIGKLSKISASDPWTLEIDDAA